MKNSIKTKNKNYKFYIVKPGGNDTCLIMGAVNNPHQKKENK